MEDVILESKMIFVMDNLRANLLVNGLLELLVVQDGPHLPVAVARPEGGGDLYL